MSKDRSRNRSGGSRPLKVGEEIRHALAAIFARGELKEPELDNASITVSEVRVSPDLKNATAYVMPLGGMNREVVMDTLSALEPTFRKLVAQRVLLRYSPRISFRLDTSFDTASRIDELLRGSKTPSAEE